jgi:Bacterial nucleoid DNA-binding protein
MSPGEKFWRARLFADDAAALVKVAEKSRSQALSMTKADLIAVIADRLKFPWARAELLVDTIFDSVGQSIHRGEKIEIRAAHPNYPYTQARSDTELSHS